MQQIIEDIELDLKELKYLLEGVQRDPHLAPVAKRRIQETIARFERICSEVDAIGANIVDETVELPEETVEIEEENIEEEKSVVLEEAMVEEVAIVPETVVPEIITAENVEQPVSGLVEEEAVIPPDSVVSHSVLGEQLKPAAELNKGLSLNDTFRFSRELFDGDTERMNRVLQNISRMSSLTEVISYLSSQIEWDEENEAVQDFNELLKKYFV